LATSQQPEGKQQTCEQNRKSGSFPEHQRVNVTQKDGNLSKA
jgi:hypothetical protein